MSKLAIIGISGLFPGSSTSEAFWNNLMQGKDLTGMATKQDFGSEPHGFYDTQKGKPDTCYSLRGGYIRDFEFDPHGFKVSAEYLARLDKLYQWSLHVAREALRDSGYWDHEEVLARTGVILGALSFPTFSSHMMMSEIYSDTVGQILGQLFEEKSLTLPPRKFSNVREQVLDVAPSEIVRDTLGLGGTHYSLDAACASSLYAIKLASDELLTGKADMMLAGAVCGSDQLFIHMGFSIFHAYADHDSKFVPLDKNSAGLVSSEGAGVVVLKRLEDAERDGDHILAVVCGTGLSNDGAGKFLLSPDSEGQQLAIKRAYETADLPPENTTYLECHATGTPLGDITELNSIAHFFKKHHAKPLLGSVKSNMGHLLTAAAMTGLHKVVLSMQKNVIPPNINLQDALETKDGYIGEQQMISRPTEWPDAHKQAGINSFGFGGTNAHTIVQNYVRGETQNTAGQRIDLQPVAIVGMEAHFGECDNLDDFYNSIYLGKQHFRALPPGRWKGFDQNKRLLRAFGFDSAEPPPGAYIDHFEIDLMRYKILPAEAQTLEPQQALILKVADNAIEDSGLSKGQNVAVLIAMETEPAMHHSLARWDVAWQVEEALENAGIVLTDSERSDLIEECKKGIYFREGKQTPSQHTSFVGNLMASRISALWDFSGPSFTISCGENSAFKALEVAQNMLSAGEVDAVVVGAVEFSGGLESVLYRNKVRRASTAKAPSISLDVKNQGWLIGEGAGAVVLKRTEEAANQPVYAIISEIGKSIDTRGVDYRELAPGAAELPAPFSDGRNRQALGCVEANFGNTFAASGMAGLIKTALCLHHRFIPGIPNWTAPRKMDSSRQENYYFPETSRPWILRKEQSKRKAVVSGLEGTQIALSESELVDRVDAVNTFLRKNLPSIFIVKGENKPALQDELSKLAAAVAADMSLVKIAADYYERSKAGDEEFTVVLVAKTGSELQREIQFFKRKLSGSFSAGYSLKTPRGSYFSPRPVARNGKVALIYPGSATAYQGLGRDLYQLFPELNSDFADIADQFHRYACPDDLYPQKVSAADPVPDLTQNAIAMMSAGVFHSTMWTHILRKYFGLQPQLAFGYSMGECSTMFYANGVWDAKHAGVFQNSPIFKTRFTGDLELLAETWNISTEEARKRWVGLLLLAPRAQVEELAAQREKVYLTFINTENEIVISGDREECYAIAEQLHCRTMEIPFQNVIHHDFCKKEHNGLMEMHQFPVRHKPPFEFLSSLTLEAIDLETDGLALNSSAVCAHPVDFPRTVRAAYDRGARIFIEVGPGGTCTGWANTILKDKEALAVSVDQKGKPEVQSLVELLAQLTSHGVHLDLSRIFPSESKTLEKRSFFHKIQPGGARIYDWILREENINKFRKSKRVAVKKELAFAEALESAAVGVSESRSFKTNGNAPAQPSSTVQKTSMTIEESTRSLVSAASSPSGTEGKTGQANERRPGMLGENGLPLLDFESGEQLEGKEIIFSQEDLVEFATGSIAKVFGPEYAIIDTYRRRVMLPMDPYLLVSRVTGLRGKTNVYEPSFMQTEYDIPYGNEFLTDGQIPSAVAVESGQCDLMLISYLGIDFENKGNLVYRLLDCTLTFVDDLAYEGQTLRYDISINSFVRNADNLLFFFSYRCYVHDRLVLKMDGGCAGFFTDEQLAEGHGVVYSESEIAARKNAPKKSFVPLLRTPKTSFSKEDLRHLINGEPEKCFGDISYYANGRNPSLRIPPEKILMLDRITSVDLNGGAYGLGTITAEKDLAPDDWYFPCHFRDDEVLAGSLQAEGGGNLLRFFMLLLGMQRLTKDARFQPIFDLPQKVRCRKQVIPGVDTKLVYKLEIKEIGLTPNPYVIGDLEIISNNVITVHFENLGLQIREKDNPRYLELQREERGSPRSKNALLKEKDIEEFALGALAKVFGDDFKLYEGRRSSRQPNTDLQLISRVISIDGTRGDFSKPATCHAEYDVPHDAWYFEQNSNATIPYSILMEIALQPCGLMGAYLGSTLQFPDKDLFFRNLDGTGEMFDLPEGTDFRGKTITNKAVLTSSVALGGTVLQNYSFECSVDGHVFYKGASSFGFFPAEALAAQIGLDNGKETPSWLEAQNLQPRDYMQIKLDSLYGKMKLYKAPEDKPHYRLAGEQLNLIDTLRLVKNGGKYGQGYIHATRFMQPYDWFFTCHFYTDPVMPGSLGVEAMLQAMQVFALQQDLGRDFVSPKFVQVPNHKTVWKYRGQILQDVEKMHLEIHFKSLERQGDLLTIVGDANLWNEGTRIYQVTDLALGIQEA